MKITHNTSLKHEQVCKFYMNFEFLKISKILPYSLMNLIGITSFNYLVRTLH